MPLVAKEQRIPKKEQLNIRLDPEVCNMLRSYSEFLDSGLHYVVEQVLRYVLRKDKEFQAWLLKNGTTSEESRETPHKAEATGSE